MRVSSVGIMEEGLRVEERLEELVGGWVGCSITVADVGGFSATTVPSNARFCVARVKLLYASASLAKRSKRRPGLNSGMAKTRTLKVRSFFFPFTMLLQFCKPTSFHYVGLIRNLRINAFYAEIEFPSSY
jgi:hypothetical protein